MCDGGVENQGPATTINFRRATDNIFDNILQAWEDVTTLHRGVVGLLCQGNSPLLLTIPS